MHICIYLKHLITTTKRYLSYETKITKSNFGMCTKINNIPQQPLAEASAPLDLVISRVVKF